MNPNTRTVVPIPFLHWRGAWQAVAADVVPALALLGGALSVLVLSGLAS